MEDTFTCIYLRVVPDKQSFYIYMFGLQPAIFIPRCERFICLKASSVRLTHLSTKAVMGEIPIDNEQAVRMLNYTCCTSGRTLCDVKPVRACPDKTDVGMLRC